MKQEDKERLKRVQKVFNEKKVSGRKFAGSIGLQPGSGAKLLGGITKLTKTLARSIELEYGYRANWLYYGEEPEKVDPLEKLDPIQRVKLEILDSGGNNPEQKVDFIKTMVDQDLNVTLLVMMLRSRDISKNVKRRGAKAKLLNLLKSNINDANEIYKKLIQDFDRCGANLSSREQIVLYCAVYAELHEMVVDPLEVLEDTDSLAKVKEELAGMVEEINRIRELIAADKETEAWLKKPFTQDYWPIPEPKDGWKRKIGHGDENET
jgi:hypothetical protein